MTSLYVGLFGVGAAGWFVAADSPRNPGREWNEILQTWYQHNLVRRGPAIAVVAVVSGAALLVMGILAFRRRRRDAGGNGSPLLHGAALLAGAWSVAAWLTSGFLYFGVKEFLPDYTNYDEMGLSAPPYTFQHVHIRIAIGAWMVAAIVTVVTAVLLWPRAARADRLAS